MGEQLKVDPDQLKKYAEALADAKSGYDALGQLPFKSNLEDLGKMQSDFVNILKKMLKNLNKNNEKLSELISGIAKISKEVAENFEEIDEKAASDVKNVKG